MKHKIKIITDKMTQITMNIITVEKAFCHGNCNRKPATISSMPLMIYTDVNDY